MKSTSFFYPYESIFKLLNSILKAKGYTITISDPAEGKITAHKKSLFKKERNLEISVIKTDQRTTHIKLMLNGNQSLDDKSLSLVSMEEEKLMDSIHRHF